MPETHPDVARRAAAGLRRHRIQPLQQMPQRRPGPGRVRQTELAGASLRRIVRTAEPHLLLVEDQIREVPRILRRGRRPE